MSRRYLTRTWQWVSGGLGVTSSALAIAAAVDEPLKLIGDMQVHAAAWVIVATVFFAMFCASMHQLIDLWMFAPRRERIARFRGLKAEVEKILSNYYQGIVDRPHRKRPEDSSYTQNVELLRITTGLNVRLRALGIGSINGKPADIVVEHEALIDMMERGALKEARKRFPLAMRRRWRGSGSAGTLITRKPKPKPKFPVREPA